MDNEPVRIVQYASAAVAATLNVLALIFGWPGETVASLNLAFSAWLVFAGELIRSRVWATASVDRVRNRLLDANTRLLIERPAGASPVAPADAGQVGGSVLWTILAIVGIVFIVLWATGRLF